MDPSSAEEYLRSLGLRAVQHPEKAAGFPPGSRLVAAGSALVAVGAISQEKAQSIVNESLDALGSNLHRVDHRVQEGSVDPSEQVLTPTTVRLCPFELKREPGRLQLHYVVFADDSVNVEVTRTGSEDLEILGSSLVLGDDTGGEVEAPFSGWVRGDVCEGRFRAEVPLSRGTEYLRVAGSKVRLHPPLHQTLAAVVEPLHPASLAERHLWLRVALGVAGQGPLRFADDFVGGAEALLAGGFIQPDSPTLAELEAVCSTFPLTPNRDLSDTLGEPWDSWKRRAYQQNGGREGAIAIGVVTPPIDGIRIRVDGLISQADGFHIRVECSPGQGFSFGHDSDIAPPLRMLWLARDDQNNHYFGHPASGWQWSPAASRGTVGFRPPLDEGATELHLLPTSLTQRGRITIPELSASLS